MRKPIIGVMLFLILTSTNAQLIRVQIVVVPEFSSFLILPLFMFATLAVVLVWKRKRLKFS